MDMPEHAHTKESPSDPALCEGATPTAQSVCDARCQGDSCRQISRECELQHCSMRDTVGECVSNSQGGCQKSTPGLPSSCCSPTCIDRAQGTLLQILAAFGLALIIARPVL